MLDFVATTSFPRFFKIGRGIVQNIASMLHQHQLDFRCVAILSGRHFSARVGRDIANSLPSSIKVISISIDEASEAAVLAVYRQCAVHDVDLILSVGGGSVIDVGKRIHRLHMIKNIAVPTIISNDGLMSPISVLKDGNGRSSSIPAVSPVGAIIDLDLIRMAPLRYLVAAAGDILSNLSAATDWLRLTDRGMTPDFNDIAYQLSIGAAQSLINYRNARFDDDVFVENIVRCQIYSGVAMTLAGSSRPCSGAEHLISHSIDSLGFTAKNMLHGIQVGSVSLFVLWLLGEEMAGPIGFARRIGLPLDWRQLGPGMEHSLPEIVSAARTVRPGRETILDDHTDIELLSACDRFVTEHIWEMS